MLDSITALIPTYNRARALQAVWPSYLQQAHIARIVVVNDGSTDDTSEVVLRLAKDSTTPVHLIDHPNKLGQQISRMDAVLAAETDWVLFGEDDVWLADDYCATLLSQARKQHAAIIAGRLVTLRLGDNVDLADLASVAPPQVGAASVFCSGNLDADFSAVVPEPIDALHLHSIALIRRDVFVSVQFDPWYSGNAFREETDFYLSTLAAGYKQMYTSDTYCYHIRGPLCLAGGQRINRLAVEYYNIRNSHYMVAKHWPYLEKQLGFRGTPLTWTIRYAWHRELQQLRRVLKSGFRSSFRG